MNILGIGEIKIRFNIKRDEQKLGYSLFVLNAKWITLLKVQNINLKLEQVDCFYYQREWMFNKLLSFILIDNRRAAHVYFTISVNSKFYSHPQFKIYFPTAHNILRDSSTASSCFSFILFIRNLLFSFVLPTEIAKARLLIF